MNFKPGLYIVSTPIGNLNDITLRAIETLQNSDIILCEDTRISGKLIAKHNIRKPLSIYNDKSDDMTRKFVIKNIESGKVISLISDAGTPLISDPGYKLVRELKEKGCFVDIIPGVCAPISALTLSGMPSDCFTFAGFLPKTPVTRAKFFKKFVDLESTLIFFDSPMRIVASLETAIKVFGNREANVSRELTKMFQESRTSKISELINYYNSNPPKGEVVLLISGKQEKNTSDEQMMSEIKNSFDIGESARDIADKMFQKYHKQYTKTQIYKICNSLK